MLRALEAPSLEPGVHTLPESGTESRLRLAHERWREEHDGQTIGHVEEGAVQLHAQDPDVHETSLLLAYRNY